MEISPPDHENDLESIRTRRGGHFCIIRGHSVYRNFFHDRALHSGSGGACPLLPKSSQVCFSPVNILHQLLCRIRQEKEPVLLSAPNWPTQPWFLDLIKMLLNPPCPIPLRRDPLSQLNGSVWHPNLVLWDSHVWPLNGDCTLQHHYSKNINPASCSISFILSF